MCDAGRGRLRSEEWRGAAAAPGRRGSKGRRHHHGNHETGRPSGRWARAGAPPAPSCGAASADACRALRRHACSRPAAESPSNPSRARQTHGRSADAPSADPLPTGDRRPATCEPSRQAQSARCARRLAAAWRALGLTSGGPSPPWTSALPARSLLASPAPATAHMQASLSFSPSSSVQVIAAPHRLPRMASLPPPLPLPLPLPLPPPSRLPSSLSPFAQLQRRPQPLTPGIGPSRIMHHIWPAPRWFRLLTASLWPCHSPTCIHFIAYLMCLSVSVGR